MNSKLKTKCDKLISLATNKTLLYSDLINEISKNKDLLRYSTTIPNALDYLEANGIEVIMPTVKKSQPKKTKSTKSNKNKTNFSTKSSKSNINEPVVDDEDSIELPEELDENLMEAIEDEAFESYEDESGNEPTEAELTAIENNEDTNYYTVDSIKQYLKDISSLHDNKLLSSEEEADLARRYQKGDILAGQLLVEYNLKLVVSIAKRYVFSGSSSLDFEDIIQVGNMGVMKAVERFDPELGFKFSTYATWWIRQSITRALADEGRTIRIPVHATEQLRYIHKAIKEIQINKCNEEQPEPEEIAKLCNERGWVVKTTSKDKIITADKVKSYLHYYDMTNAVSLFTPIGEDEHGEQSYLGDFIPDQSISVEGYAENNDLKDRFDEVFEKYLTPKEVSILKYRFGFDNREPMTLEQIGQIYGVTRERIRQIEDKAKRKLRFRKELRDLLSV